MSARFLPVCALLVVSSACLIGEVSGIPCAADATCPVDYFCDLPRHECRELTETFGPPVLRVKLITDPTGEQVTTPLVPPDTTSTIVLNTENIGRAPAENPGLSFASLACVAFYLGEDTLPLAIEAGATGSVPVDVTPGPGCDGLHIIDWFFTYSGRETRGIFDLNVKAQ